MRAWLASLYAGQSNTAVMNRLSGGAVAVLTRQLRCRAGLYPGGSHQPGGV